MVPVILGWRPLSPRLVSGSFRLLCGPEDVFSITSSLRFAKIRPRAALARSRRRSKPRHRRPGGARQAEYRLWKAEPRTREFAEETGRARSEALRAGRWVLAGKSATSGLRSRGVGAIPPRRRDAIGKKVAYQMARDVSSSELRSGESGPPASVAGPAEERAIERRGRSAVLRHDRVRWRQRSKRAEVRPQKRGGGKRGALSHSPFARGLDALGPV